MFDLPNAKRIRRADIHSNTSSRSASPDNTSENELEHAFLRAAGGALSFEDRTARLPTAGVNHDTNEQDHDRNQDADAKEDGAEEETFAFNLFKPTSRSTPILPSTSTLKEDENIHPTRQKSIRLEPSISTTQSTSNGGILNPRSASFYMRTPLTPTQARQFHAAALEGSAILSRSLKITHTWRGEERAWRVFTLPPSHDRTASIPPPVSRPTSSDEDADELEEGRRRNAKCRKGKKTRLRIRKKAARVRDKAAREVLRKEEEAVKMKEKEEHERDKKRRMNRKKQLKKREKAREMKKDEGDVQIQ